MTVYVVEATDYYGYPISRTGILGVYSTMDRARQALINDGAVCDEFGNFTYPCDGEPSTVTISKYMVDA